MPVIITVIPLHPSLIGTGAIFLFVLYLSEISVFGISVILTSFLNRSGCFAPLLSAGVTFAYAYFMWMQAMFANFDLHRTYNTF